MSLHVQKSLQTFHISVSVTPTALYSQLGVAFVFTCAYLSDSRFDGLIPVKILKHKKGSPNTNFQNKIKK